MIIISEMHKIEMKAILFEYSRSKFDAVLRKATPILLNYHGMQPGRLGK